MALFEEVVLRDSIEVKTSPEKAFKFLTNIVDDDTYRAWHKGDHVGIQVVTRKTVDGRICSVC